MYGNNGNKRAVYQMNNIPLLTSRIQRNQLSSPIFKMHSFLIRSYHYTITFRFHTTLKNCPHSRLVSFAASIHKFKGTHRHDIIRIDNSPHKTIYKGKKNLYELKLSQLNDTKSNIGGVSGRRTPKHSDRSYLFPPGRLPIGSGVC